MATPKKTVSAVARLTAEVGAAYQLTDDISIPFPTKKQIDDLPEKAGFYDLLKVVSEDAEKAIAVLEDLPVGVFSRVVEEFYLGHSPR